MFCLVLVDQMNLFKDAFDEKFFVKIYASEIQKPPPTLKFELISLD